MEEGVHGGRDVKTANPSEAPRRPQIAAARRAAAAARVPLSDRGTVVHRSITRDAKGTVVAHGRRRRLGIAIRLRVVELAARTRLALAGIAGVTHRFVATLPQLGRGDVGMRAGARRQKRRTITLRKRGESIGEAYFPPSLKRALTCTPNSNREGDSNRREKGWARSCSGRATITPHALRRQLRIRMRCATR